MTPFTMLYVSVMTLRSPNPLDVIIARVLKEWLEAVKRRRHDRRHDLACIPAALLAMSWKQVASLVALTRWRKRVKRVLKRRQVLEEMHTMSAHIFDVALPTDRGQSKRAWELEMYKARQLLRQAVQADADMSLR